MLNSLPYHNNKIYSTIHAQQLNLKYLLIFSVYIFFTIVIFIIHIYFYSNRLNFIDKRYLRFLLYLFISHSLVCENISKKRYLWYQERKRKVNHK